MLYGWLFLVMTRCNLCRISPKIRFLYNIYLVHAKCITYSRTGVNSMFNVYCLCVCSVAQLCLTLCDPMGCHLPSSSIQAIFQARILERVAISCSRGSSWPRDQIRAFCESCIVRRMLYHSTTWEALLLSRNSQMPDSLIIIIYHWSFSDFQIKVWYLCSLLQKCLLFSCGGKFKSSKKEIYDWFCMLYYGRWFHYGKHCFPKPCQHRCQMVSSTPSAVDPYHLGFWNTNSMPPTLIPFTWSRTKEAGMLTKFSLAFDFVLHDIRCCR